MHHLICHRQKNSRETACFIFYGEVTLHEDGRLHALFYALHL